MAAAMRIEVSQMDSPNIFNILRGKHPQSLTPEEETAWCWACLAAGIVIGIILAAVV